MLKQYAYISIRHTKMHRHINHEIVGELMTTKIMQYSLMIIIGLLVMIICSGCLSNDSNNSINTSNNISDNVNNEVQDTNLSNDVQLVNASENDTVIAPQTAIEINTTNTTDVVNNTLNLDKIMAFRRAHNNGGAIVSSSTSSSSDSSGDSGSDSSIDTAVTAVTPTNDTSSYPMIPANISWSVNSSVVDVEGRGVDGIRRPGDIVSYVVNVTNTGNTTLTNIVANDSATLSSDSGTTKGTLLPGETWTLHGAYTTPINDMIDHDTIVWGTSVSCNELGTQTIDRTVPINCKYKSYQPTAPPEEAKFAGNTTYDARSYYVGADGHRITLLVNESAVNPTFQQLVDFTKADKTNEIPYNSSSFVCGDYAELVQNNAEMSGYRCAWVSIDFTGETAETDPVTGIVKIGHACNLFNTVDKGLIGIDCTQGTLTGSSATTMSLDMWDSEVSLIVGGQYQQNLLYSFPGSEQILASPVGTVAAFFPFRDSQVNDI